VNEDSPRIVRAYKRAAIGLAAAAVLWTIAFLLVQRNEGYQGGLQNWLIPLGAAVLSAWFFVLYAKAKD
jgi:hypothetical protein